MERRDFLKGSLLVGSQVLAGFTLVSKPWLARAQDVSGIPFLELQKILGADQAILVTPSDPSYKDYLVAFNLRTQLAPKLRVLCKTAAAVATTVRWARSNNVAFAVRCGGHSYEGFSQSSNLVIDLRLMNGVQFDPAGKTVDVEGGCSLADVYAVVGRQNQAIAAGSCPTVGVGGHITGGGYGHLARAFGLACDNVLNFDLVDAKGEILTASETQNPDLYWACRGGGGGSFGIITRFRLRTHAVPNLTMFRVSWVVPLNQGVELIQAWQEWAPKAPESVSSFLHLGRPQQSSLRLLVHCSGQTTDTGGDIRAQLSPLMRLARTSLPLVVNQVNFTTSVKDFAGTFNYVPEIMKGKSDYITTPLSADGANTLLAGLQSLPPGAIGVTCDAYGGAINNLRSDETAFAHREGTLFGIQYSTSWKNPADGDMHIARIRTFYQSLRPFVSGGCYVNYPDLDLGESYDVAYWKDNLPRLQRIKSAYDPENVFNHAQSIRPG